MHSNISELVWPDHGAYFRISYVFLFFIFYYFGANGD